MMPVQASRRLFTVPEYYRMAEAGIFGEDDRVELLSGEIVEMTPIGSRHAAAVSRRFTFSPLASPEQRFCGFKTRCVWTTIPSRNRTSLSFDYARISIAM